MFQDNNLFLNHLAVCKGCFENGSVILMSGHNLTK